MRQRAVYQYTWIFDVNGQQKTVINRGEDPKIDGTLLGVETSVLQKGYEPPIHDFSIERDGVDYTTQMLEEEHLLVVIAYNLDVAQNEGFIAIKEATDTATRKRVYRHWYLCIIYPRDRKTCSQIRS